MTKTKIILLVFAMSLVIMAAIGVVYAQSVNAQNQNGAYSQTPTQGSNGYYECYPPNIGKGYNCNTLNPQQDAYPNRMGMGMCGRYW
jgi:hypothetical protein